ncbi:hypothetical protein GEI7407_0912 [Geitlerinema sp. PCC 7407]|nr:hypothetical protein GEI7407_0912 [Geitlerinema sp. PCC 7407]
MLGSVVIICDFREICKRVEATFQFIFQELRQSTRASEVDCRAVAGRLSAEVSRICLESQRIQDSGQSEAWAMTLARHRLQQCLRYYRLKSRQGRVELHSTLSAIVYRYISPPQAHASYQARVLLIEDFLQSFYLEALNAFRREAELGDRYSPATLLELAEYMAFCERYAKRPIPLPGRRKQQLVILRAQTFSRQQPQEALVDIEQAAEGAIPEDDQSWGAASLQQVRDQMVAQDNDAPEATLRTKVINELTAYLKQRKQADCAEYFQLRLKDFSASEIEAHMGLTPRERDYLQQRFKYHLIRFALSHEWELVHQWLEADLEKNLGLTPQQWQELQQRITVSQARLLELKQARQPDGAIAQKLGCSLTQVQRQWSKLLEQAWEIRNQLISGTGASTDE